MSVLQKRSIARIDNDTNLMNFMNYHRNFVIMGIGAAALITVISGCTTVQGQNTTVQGQDRYTELQDFVGNWQLVSGRQGNQTESPKGRIRLERSDRRLIGVLSLSSVLSGFLELTPGGDKRKLEGNLYIIGFSENTLRIPVSLELAENKQDLNLLIMTTQVDKKSLPEEFTRNFPEDFTAENLILSSRRLTEDDIVQQTSKARQLEGRNNIGAFSRAQQAYFMEQNRFSSNLDDLGVGIKSETENYSYSINLIGASGVQGIAIPRKNGLRSVTSGIFVIKDDTNNEATTSFALCESEQPSKSPPPPPQLIGKEIQCPSGFRKL